ncbi:4791_t:CDS:10 [Funneliformis mosseae]|uniref:4791_t:CDS:1 n=1 Tax=Funneliformis mosseae TaxID=27381 RepID=A0A9N9CDV2_FUNMO|nr:4791_t:CDS:10 [Funneliformis mosseae]
MEKREQANVDSKIPGRHFHLPFEFNDTNRLGPWEILLSESTIKDIREMLYNEDFNDMQIGLPLKIEIVMKKLRQISSGAWKKFGLQREASSHNIPVYEVELPTNNLKILWQVDYGFSIHIDSFTQHVKVWAVTASQKQINKTLKALKSVHEVYTSEHIRRCAIQVMRKDNVVLPECFVDGGTRFKEELDDEKLLEAHKMFVTNKFIPISRDLFKSLAFLVSKTEYEIINDPSSAVVFGRSGTGKTTCIVFRLLISYLKSQLYKTPSLHIDNENFYKRQIFITLNPILCLRVKKYFKQLQKSAELAGETISKAQFIAWKKECGSSKTFDDNNMHEEDDVKKILGEIPNSFRLLTDQHFPLFITYEKFSEMLLGTYGIDARMLTTKQKQKHNADNDNAYNEEEYRFWSPFANASWATFVDYDLFEKKYWRNFGHHYSNNLDCELVYSEFSIIKGTNTEVDYLSREEYRSLSTKKYPAFCHNRDTIYNIFERYEKMKARNYDFDSVDRTLAILRATETKVFGGPHIHEVYIDECQDNRIIDYELILKLFGHAESIFLAGDVAQCIAQGLISIDLRACQLFKPKMFELNINYRSHKGILQLASSIIHLLRVFFPDSIDQLSPEISEVGGPQPIIIEGCEAETLFIYRKDDKKEDVFIEFGADQVIIVRDESSKKRVKDIYSDIGLVLTVFEAKGMEFNDVLLYNFFTDSPAHLKWQVILSDLDDNSEWIRKFSSEKHYILSSELKHLYVAITRAREHLWIFDEDAKLSESIRTYWVRKKLVKVTNGIDVSKLTKTSSSYEWNREGRMFFEQRNYEQAIFCFKKSRNEEGENLAHAYYLQQVARTSVVTGSDEKTVNNNFKSAARAFEECSRKPQAASCYESIRMYKKAGNLYSESEMFEDAARCYLAVNMWDVAGGYFEKANKYDEAAIAYKDGNHYDMVADLIQRHRLDINDKTICQLTNHFHKEAENHLSQNKFEETADMLQYILRLCRIIVLEEIIANFTSSSIMQELCKLQTKAAKTISKFQSERSKSLVEESRLYISYFNKDLNVYDVVTDLIQMHRQEINDEMICQLSTHFHKKAENLLSYNKFEETADMLQYLLRLCRIIVLEEINTGFTSYSILQELCKLQIEAFKTMSKVQSKRSKILMEESKLYIAYLNNDLNIYYVVTDLIQRHRQDINDETIRQFSIHFYNTAKEHLSHKMFDEAADMLYYLLRICRVIVLEEVITGFTSSNILQELCKLQIKAAKIISRVPSDRSKNLMEGSQLYISYLNKDLNIYDIITVLIQRHRQVINDETIRQLNNHFRKKAEKLLSQNKFEEAADMLNRSVDNDDNILLASQHLLRLCRDNVLKEIIAGSSTQQELSRLQFKAAKAILKVKIQSDRSNNLMEESQLYISYLNKDLNIYDIVTDLIQRHRQDINDETIRQLNNHFRKEAEKLLLLNKFEEAADMLNHSVDNDDNVTDASQCLLRLCRVIVLEDITTDFTSSCTLQELCRLQSKAAKAISKITIQSKRSKNLMEESLLYISYLNEDLNIYDLMIDLILRHRQDINDETIRQLSIHIQKEAEKLHSHNKFEEAADILQYLLHLCRIIVLEEINAGFIGSSILHELCKLQTETFKTFSKDQSKRSKVLMEESQLYISYLNNDLNIYDIITDLIQRYRQDINDEVICQLSTHFHNEAEKHLMHNKFEEAADMLQYLLRLCRVIIMEEIITGFASSSILHEFYMLQTEALKTISKVQSERSKSLMEESRLYISYFNKDLNIYDMVTELIQRLDINDKTTFQLSIHFHKKAENLLSYNKFEEAADMLQHLLRLCRIILLEEIITDFTSPSILQELCKLQIETAKTISRVQSKRSKNLMEESLLYISYLNKDLNIYDMVTYLIHRHRQDINDETIRQLNNHFRKEAEKLLSQNKFEEAADMLNRSVDNDENIINASQYLLSLCRINVLKELITDFTSSSARQELSRFQSKAAETISKVQSSRSKILMEESLLYISYLNKDLNQVHECRKFFMKHEEFFTEFLAVILWLQIPSPSEFNIKYWDERLQCLLRLCKLAFPYISPQKNVDIAKISKGFENIFLCFGNKTKIPQKLNIFSYDPLYVLLDIKIINKENEEAILDSWKVFDVDVVHQTISQFLISYIYKLISKIDQDGRAKPNIASIICFNYASSSISNYRMHYVTSTSLLLFQRLKLARLQYTVVRQLNVLFRHGLLNVERKAFLASQKWWAKNLVKCHMRYQSPHTRCPEVTSMALAKLPIRIRDDLINEAYKTWLAKKSKNEVMVKFNLASSNAFGDLTSLMGFETSLIFTVGQVYCAFTAYPSFLIDILQHKELQ